MRNSFKVRQCDDEEDRLQRGITCPCKRFVINHKTTITKITSGKKGV